MFACCVTAKQQAFATEGLSGKDHNICGAAIGIFRSLLDSLHNRSVTPKQLKTLINKIDQVNKIIEAIDDTSTEGRDLALSPKNIFSKRKHEYSEFQKYCEQLQHLYLQIVDLNVEGKSSWILISACNNIFVLPMQFLYRSCFVKRRI